MTSLDPGARALLAVVLAVAATSKVRSRAAFLDLVPDLARYGLPAPLVRPWVAAAVVALEGAGAVLLLAAPAAGYLVAGSLAIGFSAGTARVLRRGVRATCRCFGGAETPIDSTHLVRNLLLVLVAAVGGWARIALPAPTWSAAAGAVVVGAGIGAAITRSHDLAALVLGPALPLPTGDER